MTLWFQHSFLYHRTPVLTLHVLKPASKSLQWYKNGHPTFKTKAWSWCPLQSFDIHICETCLQVWSISHVYTFVDIVNDVDLPTITVLFQQAVHRSGHPRWIQCATFSVAQTLHLPIQPVGFVPSTPLLSSLFETFCKIFFASKTTRSKCCVSMALADLGHMESTTTLYRTMLG